jgi:hypothetical protein
MEAGRAMHADIPNYNAAQPAEYRAICRLLAEAIDAGLPKAESKIWHRAPVWFIDGNPIVGYWVRKGYVQLLFWSGQSFEEPGLEHEGKFKAAQRRLTTASDVDADAEALRPGLRRDLRRWLTKARKIQWDYKNIVKRRGVLEKIGRW